MIKNTLRSTLPWLDFQTNHICIGEGIDISNIKTEITQNISYFGDGRAKKVPVQRNTKAVSLLGPIPLSALQIKTSTTKESNRATNNIQKIIKTKEYYLFPNTTKFLEDFAQSMNATLQATTIVALKPNSVVYEHVDDGLYYTFRDRYHLVIQSSGSYMVNGGQQTIFKDGELWWYNNKVPHSSYNDSDEDRIHVIFDLLPRSYFRICKNIVMRVYCNWKYGRVFYVARFMIRPRDIKLISKACAV